MERLANLKVSLVASAKVVKVEKDRVEYIRGGFMETVESVDTILLAAGLIPEKAVVSTIEAAKIRGLPQGCGVLHSSATSDRPMIPP